MTPAILYVAKFETPNFSFEAYGIDPESAIETLVEAWQKHSEQTDADPDYLTEYLQDIRIYAVGINRAFRDTEQLTGDALPVNFYIDDNNELHVSRF